MDDEKKRWWADMIFRYAKLVAGVFITFFPFNLTYPFKEIITILGVLVVLSAGIEIEFRHRDLPVIKPS